MKSLKYIYTLHYKKIMSDLLEEISETNQIIYTTHSPLMLKGVKPEDVRLTYLDATNTFTHIATTNISQILDEIGYSTADVLHCDFVIIVEGKEDVRRIRLILDKFYPTLNQDNIVFIDSKSCANIKAFATLLFLNRTTLKENFIIIRDSDSRNRADILNEFISERNDMDPTLYDNIRSKMFITKYSALDNYFVDLEIIQNITECELTVLADLIMTTISTNKDKIISNWQKHNIAQERILELTQYFFEETNDFNDEYYIEVKKYIRAHNLINLIKREPHSYRDEAYIENSTAALFDDIIQFLNEYELFSINFVVV